MAKMQGPTTKKVTIKPRAGAAIPDLLPNNQFITEETEMNLNTKEIQRAMQFAELKAGDTPLDPTNFNDEAPAASESNSNSNSDSSSNGGDSNSNGGESNENDEEGSEDSQPEPSGAESNSTIDRLEDDDVENVYHTAEFPDDFEPED